MPAKIRRTTTTQPESPEFANAVELLAIFSDCDARLKEIESEASAQLLEILDDKKKEYATLQGEMTKAETALEGICRAHPEWFVKAKSVKTPYGKVSFHSGTSLVIENEEATVKLIRALKAAETGELLRSREEPNIEALEKMPDHELARLMVKRVTKDNFSVTPARVDFGKAVKEAAEATQAA